MFQIYYYYKQDWSQRKANKWGEPYNPLGFFLDCVRIGNSGKHGRIAELKSWRFQFGKAEAAGKYRDRVRERGELCEKSAPETCIWIYWWILSHTCLTSRTSSKTISWSKSNLTFFQKRVWCFYSVKHCQICKEPQNCTT